MSRLTGAADLKLFYSAESNLECGKQTYNEEIRQKTSCDGIFKLKYPEDLRQTITNDWNVTLINEKPSVSNYLSIK